MSTWIPVIALTDLTSGDYAQAEVDGTLVAVFNIDGELFAIEDTCTHDGGGLTGGAIEGCKVVCPRHGAKFCLRTGEALTPPAYEAVRTFSTRVREGIVEVQSTI